MMRDKNSQFFGQRRLTWWNISETGHTIAYAIGTPICSAWCLGAALYRVCPVGRNSLRISFPL